MNIDMLERRFRAFDERIKSVETGVPVGAAPAAPAGPTAEEESARVAKIYEDLSSTLKAELDALVAAAKAEIQAFIASLPAPAAPAPAAPAPVAEEAAAPADEPADDDA
jgi:hypothetical protein